MKVFILLSVVAVALASRQCGENQHYESCGTACPLTCENYDDPPIACVLMCNPGCHCDKGYVKAEDGRCVRPEECPGRAQQVCGENQRYFECGSACPLTCDNFANPPKICPAMCVIGCQCETGFVKTRDGRCVRPEECSGSAPLPVERSCVDKPDSGKCDAYFPMWYSDMRSGKCDQFVYGGCQGNGNRYETEEECMEHCQVKKSCVDRVDSGMCDGYYPMWYYDVRSQKCDQFVYGGCQGNGNRYGTEEECMEHCHDKRSCLDKPDSGICYGYFPMWYYDVRSGKCDQFVYGGCQGNGNRYGTEEECMGHCQGITLQESSVNRCDLHAETGPCRALFRKFYFDKTTGQCQRFIYGGCGGNENNFETIDECNQACGAQLAPGVCTLPAEIGLCRGYFPKYYWDTESSRCQKFIYGGCGGNGNNFNTLEECETTCA